MAEINDYLRILWISDIHYREYKHNQQERLNEYIEEFVTQVKDIDQERKIDYILFSGDIAFDGTEKSYRIFKKEIIEKLYELFKDNELPKIITVPGNHDVCWEKINFLGDYMKKNRTKRNEFLKANADRFKMLFENYSNAFKPDPEQAYFKFFDATSFSLEDFPNPYPDHKLFGYLVDYQKHILFVLLNSAWYSIGTEFNKILLKYIRKDSPRGKDIAKRILLEKDSIKEYGGQIVGRDLISEVSLNKVMEHCSDFITVVCMHHPINWLEWTEVYHEDKGALQLPKILEQGDLLLTGHEHLPSHIEPDILYNDTIHFKAGKFLDDQILEGESSFTGNRFSVLDIEKVFSNPVVIETKYRYTDRWVKLRGVNRKIKKKINRLKIDRLKKCVGKFRLREYILDEILHSNKDILSEQKDIKYLQVNTRNLFLENTNHLYIFSTDPVNLFSAIINSPELLRSYSGKIPECCTFIFPDIFIDDALTESYADKEFQRYEILNKFVHKADERFDEFRKEFFSRFSQGSSLDFRETMNIRFINHVVSYWIMEKYATDYTV